MTASTKSIADDLGWALVKPTLTAEEYMPVRVIRQGKRFTFVETLDGRADRYSTRGLWDGLPSLAACEDEIANMRAYRAAKARAELVA